MVTLEPGKHNPNPQPYQGIVPFDGETVASEPLARPYGRSNADVLQGTMGVTPEPPTEGSDLLRRYLNLVEQASLDDPRPPVPHDEAMARIRAKLESLAPKPC